MYTDKLDVFKYVGKMLGSAYGMMLRVFRNEYNWSCSDVDSLPISRIMTIYEETLEDIETKKDMYDK